MLELLCNLSQAVRTSAPGILELLQLLPNKEESILLNLSEREALSATVLPIRSVGVQVGVVIIYIYIGGV